MADRSIKIPRGEIKDVLIKVDEFIFPVDFIILDTESMMNSRGQILAILGRPFLTTSNALINCHGSLMKLIFKNMTVDLNIFNLEGQQNDPFDQSFAVNLIQDISSGHLEEDKMD